MEAIWLRTPSEEWNHAMVECGTGHEKAILGNDGVAGLRTKWNNSYFVLK